MSTFIAAFERQDMRHTTPCAPNIFEVKYWWAIGEIFLPVVLPLIVHTWRTIWRYCAACFIHKIWQNLGENWCKILVKIDAKSWWKSVQNIGENLCKILVKICAKYGWKSIQNLGENRCKILVKSFIRQAVKSPSLRLVTWRRLLQLVRPPFPYLSPPPPPPSPPSWWWWWSLGTRWWGTHSFLTFLFEFSL